MHPRVLAFMNKYGRVPTETDPDYLEMLRMGKYRILDVPDVTPGSCSNCGASKNDERKYVDIGRHIDWYGALFFCTLCLKDIATTAGLFKDLEKEIEELKAKLLTIDELKKRGIELSETVKQTFGNFEEFYASIHSAELGSNPDNYTDSDLTESKTEQGVSKTESSIEPAKPRVTKSTSVSRPKNILSLAETLGES